MDVCTQKLWESYRHPWGQAKRDRAQEIRPFEEDFRPAKKSFGPRIRAESAKAKV